MRKQMGTSTKSGVNECQNAEATLPQERNVAIVFLEVKRSRELCLNPICSVSFRFHTRQGLKRSMVSDIDFLTRQLSTTVLLSFFPTFILFSSSLLLCILLLSFLFSYFICLFLLNLSHLCSYSQSGSAYQKKRKESTFRSPLLPFPKIPWED